MTKTIVAVLITLGTLTDSFIFAQCSQDCNGSNTFFGEEAGQINTGNNNSFFGSEAGDRNETGFSNSFFGSDSGLNNTSASFNSFFGSGSGFFNSSGSANSFFGTNSGSVNTVGNSNVYIGFGTGSSNNGNSNTFLGRGAGAEIVSGSGNIIIGRGAGPTDANSQISNRLYIDFSESNDNGNDEPLIYGEFDNHFVRINGTFEVTAGLTNPSSISLKERFTSVSSSLILNQINSLDIQEWSYKGDPEVRHIGPTAESFYDTFGLGEGSHNISTIDADGVSLLAIQALFDEIQEKAKRIELLEKSNAQLNLELIDKDKKIVDIEERLKNIEILLQTN